LINNPVNTSVIFQPIQVKLKYVMNTAGNPGMIKQF